MINSRQKGKRLERYFAGKLRPIFPEIQRNANGQSQEGGIDLRNTDPFNFEVKGGKYAKIKKIREWLEQVATEGKRSNYDVLLIKPEREEPYVVMPYDAFHDLIEGMYQTKTIQPTAPLEKTA